MGDKIERFEDLIAWQKARALTGRIYRLANTGQLKQDFGLKDHPKSLSFNYGKYC